jgi:quercetin dioxygenase-like cupin family protein
MSCAAAGIGECLWLPDPAPIPRKTRVTMAAGWVRLSRIRRRCCAIAKDACMKITRNGTQPSSPGPAANFTGHVRRDTLFANPAPSRMVGGAVTFDPGARTVWHTHPLGQILIFTAGLGRVQSWGHPVEEVGPGDIVWFAPGEKHWHGAAVLAGASHIALVEAEAGETTDWMEPVTDEQISGRF